MDFGKFFRRKEMVKNNAGGPTFELDRWKRLERVLILGTEGSTFYTSAHDLTKEAIDVIDECIDENGVRLVHTVAAVSQAGRAPKNSYAIFAIARASKLGDLETRQAANKAMKKVCRTGTHLFEWVSLIKLMGGFSRGSRRALQDWYNQKNARDVGYQVLKYRQRQTHGQSWTHRDVLRCAHPRAASDEHGVIFDWVCRGWPGVGQLEHPNEALKQIWAFERLKEATTHKQVASLIRQHALPRECVDGKWFSGDGARVVWEALLERMPIMAMTRNLANMTRAGVFKRRKNVVFVVRALTNSKRIGASRIHPIHFLAALMTYKSGTSVRGSNTWTPVRDLSDALEKAFYLAFDSIEDTGKRFNVAVDVSGSMTWGTLMGVPGLTPREGAAVMAMAVARTQKKHKLKAFSHQLTGLPVTANDKLAQVIKKTSSIPMGATDCSLPILKALEAKERYDVFVVLTDNETWYGSRTHGKTPHEALAEYRRKMRINAKLIVVGMTATKFSIADPNDPGMLDVVGFDSAAPRIMMDFVEGF